jgi:hypothetical protein
MRGIAQAVYVRDGNDRRGSQRQEGHKRRPLLDPWRKRWIAGAAGVSDPKVPPCRVGLPALLLPTSVRCLNVNPRNLDRGSGLPLYWLPACLSRRSAGQQIPASDALENWNDARPGEMLLNSDFR